MQKKEMTAMKLASAALLMTLTSSMAHAQVNVGEQKPEANLPFKMTTVNTYFHTNI